METPTNLSSLLLQIPRYGTLGSGLLPRNLLHEWGKIKVAGSWIKDLGFKEETIELGELERRFRAGESFCGNMNIHTKKIENWTIIKS